MIDTNTAKELLQSSDLTLLRSSIKEYRDYLTNEGHSLDGAVTLQLIKLEILLNSRVLQLQMSDPATTQAELATTYAGIAHSWNLMGDGEKCEGQLKKSLACDPNCTDALIVRSELYSSQARFNDAVDSMQKVISIVKESSDSPKYSLIEAYLKLAAVHEMMGNFDDATAVLKEAIDDFKREENEDSKQTQLIKIELYGRLGTIQDKLGLYGDAVNSLSVAVTELKKCFGEKHTKTQEYEYILDMATNAMKG